MLWTALRWNSVNTLAVAAFCLLPFLAFAGGIPDGAGRTRGTPVADLQRDNLELAVPAGINAAPASAAAIVPPASAAMADASIQTERLSDD
jgi:hypothetical protein